VILIIIILVRFMQPPCMLNLVQFTACLLAHLACVCLAKLWTYVDEVRVCRSTPEDRVFVVNIRLTARLQSLPLARCWRAFSPF